MGKKLKGRSSRERGRERERPTPSLFWARTLLLLLHANLIKSCNKIYGCLLGATNQLNIFTCSPETWCDASRQPDAKYAKVFAILQVL